MLNAKQIERKIIELTASYAARDRRHNDVHSVRDGNLGSVFPDLFGTISDQSFVANSIDVIARDMAEMIGPIPGLNCASGVITSDRARNFASKRQRIGIHYWLFSNLKLQTTPAADNYLTYGYVPAIVEPDFDKKFPRIRFMDPRGGYPEFGKSGDTVSYTQVHRCKASQLAAMYPSFADRIYSVQNVGSYQNSGRDQDLHVHTYVDADQTWVGIKERPGLVLENFRNILGECPIQCAVRPSGDGEIRGQFDDVLAPQAAKAFMAALTLEAAEKTVQAPIIAPDDMVELTIGPDAIMRTANPAGVGRLKMDVSNASLVQGQTLEQEIRTGTRYPEGRSGQVQGSIVTGRGVEALLGTFDTQIKTAQNVFGELLRKLTTLAFKLDEMYWPDHRKEIRGSANGAPFSDFYTPAKDINGDFTCDVSYGMMAGMDPNRGLVFILQAMGAGLIDRMTGISNLPFDIDPNMLVQNIEVEKMREALLAGMQATAQSMGPIIEQGGDPTQILNAMAKAIKERQAGKTLEDAMLAFSPPPPPPQAPGDPNAPPGGDPNAPPGGSAGPGGQLPPGQQPSGLLQGVAPGQAGMAPGGRPALNQLMASLGQSGKPNLTAGVRRSLPA